MKKKEEKKVIRKYWTRPIFQEENRKNYGDGDNLIVEMRLYDQQKYFNYLRMSPEKFDQLLSLIVHKFDKLYVVRKPIAPSIRLAVTLRYLATGDSITSISYAFRIGISTASLIIEEVCTAIWECLHRKVLIEPDELAWKNIANGFEKWNFPNCIGALDGKHVVMQAQPNSGSSNYNYKGSHSLVLLAMCDAFYRFILVDIGAPGRTSDGGVFRNSLIGQKFQNSLMNLPPASSIGDAGPTLPYVFVADEAFGLTTYSMRPYPRNNLSRKKKIFNYRLSRARRVVENAFGILAGRWRIYRRPIIANSNKIKCIIQATVCLHNYLISEDKRSPNDPYRYLNLDEDVLELPADGLIPIQNTSSNNHTQLAAQVREEFANYFEGEGAVDWQWEKAMMNEI